MLTGLKFRSSPQKIPHHCKIPHPNSAVGSLFAQEDCPEAENPPPTDRENSPAETVLLPAQGEITIGWNEDGGLILRQSDWPNEDAVIVIARDYIDLFIDRLTDAMGIPSTKNLL